MSRIPRVTGLDLLAALSTAGVAVIRIKGSHHFVRHEDGADQRGGVARKRDDRPRTAA